MLILKPNEALSQWNAHLKASLKKAYEYHPTTIEASNCLHYGENRVVFCIWNADRTQQTLFGKNVDKIKISALDERTVNALAAQKPLLRLEMKLPPAVFAALWAKRDPSYEKYSMDLGMSVGFIENDDITQVLSDAAADEEGGVTLPALRTTSDSDSSEMAVSLMLAPEAMAKKDAFHRQFIALRKVQPYAPLKKHTVLIPPYRVHFSVWNTKTKKCVLETEAEVFPPLFEALWTKRDSSKYLVENGVQYCPIDESNVTPIFQAAVQATA